MLQTKPYPAQLPQSNAIKVRTVRSTKSATKPRQQEQNIVVVESKRYKVRLTKEELPLTVTYGESTYVIAVAKGDKLLLQKHLE
jgi:hypothetical protein